MRFRQKPVVIEAVQWTGRNRDEARTFLGDGFLRWGEGGTLRVGTLEGPHTASPGDWLIRGVKGEFYPCKPGIFEVTYEPVHALDQGDA